MEEKRVDLDDIKIGDLIASTHKGNTNIYRAVYQGKEYALKAIKRSSIETQKEMEHLMNERNALRELNHPSINKIIDTVKDATNLYFLIEIVYGIPLHELLRMRSNLSVAYSQLILIQVINAFEYMHDKGYIYRDLKASNLIINTKGKVTLIDLGFIKKIGSEMTNSFCGTIHMIAPELYNDKLEEEGYSYPFDIYSLGILLYELVIGKAPFGYEEENMKEKILAGIKEELFQDIKDLPQLVNIIKLMLDKDPLKRPTLKQIKCHPFFKNLNMRGVELIVNCEYSKVSDEENKQFDIPYYEEDIEDFGLASNVISEEEQELNDKLSDAFSGFG